MSCKTSGHDFRLMEPACRQCGAKKISEKLTYQERHHIGMMHQIEKPRKESKS